ncbi:MAG: T9SS type A sorting domain-containing protein, partial [Bacteroidales bacterium]
FTPDTIASLSTDTIGITINTTGLAPGNYNTKIFINCNNPVSPIIEIPISLIVSGIKVVNPIADVLKNEGFVSDTIDYSNVFVDAEGDELFYTIVSAEPGVVTVDTADGKILIDETGTGTSTITIRADDGGGSIEYFDFEYRVNANPKVITPIADILINEGFLTTTINLSEVFTDTDNDVLNYEFTNSSQETVGVSITDNILTIQEVAYGVSTISVTATDNIGIPAEDEFLITVNAMPELSKAISDTLVHEGFSSYTVDLSKIFTDADDDVLKYALTNSNPAAVSISVTDKILTIQEVAYGVSTVSVTASDSIGIPVSDEFVVTVNAIPTVANPLADIALDEGFVTRTVVLSNVFADNDDAQLVLSAVSSNPAVVTVSVTGTTLTVTETGTGTSNITVTAEDSKGASVSDMFVFTVNDISAVESITDAIIEFYPNPTKGKIYLSMGKGDNNQVNVEFTNIAGKVLMNYQFNNSGKVQELDLTRFAKGIYFMRIIYNDHSMIEKIIIEQ